MIGTLRQALGKHERDPLQRPSTESFNTPFGPTYILPPFVTLYYALVKLTYGAYISRFSTYFYHTIYLYPLYPPATYLYRLSDMPAHSGLTPALRRRICELHGV